MALKGVAVIDGEEVEVELKGPPAGFIAEDVHSERMQSEVTRRVNAAKQNARTELLNDEQFLADAKKKLGIEDGPGDKQLTPDQVKQLRTEWEREHLAPLTEKLKASETTVGTTRQAMLKAELKAALSAAGVKPQLVDRFAELEAGRFGYDEQHGVFAIRKGDTYAYSGKADRPHPWQGVEDFADQFVKDKGNADFVASRSQNGPGIQTTGDAKPLTITRSEAQNARLYREREAAAKTAGVELVVTD